MQTMDVSFFQELVRRRADRKNGEMHRLLELNEVVRAQIALGGLKACEELEGDLRIQLGMIERVRQHEEEKAKQCEERRQMRRLQKAMARREAA